ncbi:MAG: flagella synthesis protein FlgN [Burkholderiales bacterium]
MAASPLTELVENTTVELHALESFIDLLKQENDVLARDDIESLVTLATAKSAVMETLSQCATRRARILKSIDPTSDLDSILENHSPLRPLWNKLTIAARHAAELNYGNSYAVFQRLAKVHRALGALGADRSSTYDPRGTTVHRMDATRSFGQA